MTHCLAAVLAASFHLMTSAHAESVPCRIQDTGNPDLWVMTLGEVRTPLAQGTFDPRKDLVTLGDGSTREDYFKKTLGVEFYQPMDRTRFPLPTSGWCSWYYYYNRVNSAEVRKNTDWLAANLKDFGARVVQIDDGWQGVDRIHGGRDWSQTNPERFPEGLGALASHIKSSGFTPGLWIAPHGQSNPEVIERNPGLFLKKTDGSSASDTWEGKWLMDPTAPGAGAYMKDLFATYAGLGYDYFKIDGQPIVAEEYATKRQFMAKPSDDAAELYRGTLRDIRAGIGPDRFLLGCWGFPIEGAGLMDGVRTGGDIVPAWEGFLVSLRATFQFYHLHNTVWYTDPDVLLVRSPLTLDQARAWATLQGLTGQTLMSSDRLPDLSDDRVELLKRVFPAAGIRPLDRFPVTGNKRIWDLKVAHLGRNYDVVGLFNFDEGKSRQAIVKWADLGLSHAPRHHVFDFWNQDYLGSWEAGTAIELAPTSCRVLAVVPDSGAIELVSTSRHITQGWVDLVALKSEEGGRKFSGTSRVIKGDPYTLSFAFPRGKNFNVKAATAGGKPIRISNHQGWCSVTLDPETTGEIDWQVEFAAAYFHHFPPSAPESIWVERTRADGIEIRWQDQYYASKGYQVYLDGELQAWTESARLILNHLDPLSRHTLAVASVWEDGVASKTRTEISFTMVDGLPAEIALAELEPVRSSGVRGYWPNEVPSPATLVFGGRRHEGVAALVGSSQEFELSGLFDTFSATVVVAPSTPADVLLDFIVSADGKELWRSGPMKAADAPRPVQLKIAGAARLELRIDGDSHGSKPGYHSNHQGGWADATLLRSVKR